MSIPRVKPGGWATNEELFSTQITDIDINASSALDKRSGQSDTLDSSITVSSLGSITGAASSTLNWSGSATFNQSFSLSILSNATVAGALTLQSPSVLNLNGILNTNLNETSDCTLTLATRTSDASIHNIFIKGQAPFASATTNIFAGNVFVDLQGSLAAATLPASFYIRDSLDVMLQVKRSAVKANNPSAANGVVMTTGTGIGMSITTADNNSVPGLNAGGITIQPGTGTNLCGNIAILAGQANTSGATPGHITMQGGTGVNMSGSGGNAGYVTINGGLALNASNTGGAVNINGGSAFLGANSTGGSVFVTGGQGSDPSTGGGHVYLTGAAGYNFGGTSSSAGKIIINGGISTTLASSSAGIVSIQGGEGQGVNSIAGNIAIAGGLGSGSGATGGNVFITGGNGSGGKGNIALNAAFGFFGSGNGVIFIATDNTDPTTNPASGIILYVDAAGNLKARTSAGNVRTIAAV